MENLREVRDMSQEQAPPEAHESLSHPSGDGEGLGVGCGAGLGSSIFSVLPGYGGGAARLGLVALGMLEGDSSPKTECWSEKPFSLSEAGNALH